MAIAKRNEGAKVNSNINVTPMVDVMLVLLIIFMVITPMLQKGLPVELAKTQHPIPMQDQDKTDAVTLGISHDGKIFLNNKLVTVDQITDQVKDMIQDRLDKTVFIRADSRAQYGNVADVVDAVRAAGVDKVGMITQQV
ncbi:MAG TPA: biopolymer transporter ExbD, partial [Terriglobales bacterium]|nr:biopolymer transporter ExbD [Terriglobales bacterium]